MWVSDKNCRKCSCGDPSEMNAQYNLSEIIKLSSFLVFRIRKSRSKNLIHIVLPRWGKNNPLYQPQLLAAPCVFSSIPAQSSPNIMYHVNITKRKVLLIRMISPSLSNDEDCCSNHSYNNVQEPCKYFEDVVVEQQTCNPLSVTVMLAISSSRQSSPRTTENLQASL